MEGKNKVLDSPVAGAYMTYLMLKGTARSILKEDQPQADQEKGTSKKTFKIVDYRGELCLKNNQGVNIPLRFFTNSKRVIDYHTHPVKD